MRSGRAAGVALWIGLVVLLVAPAMAWAQDGVDPVEKEVILGLGESHCVKTTPALDKAQTTTPKIVGVSQREGLFCVTALGPGHGYVLILGEEGLRQWRFIVRQTNPQLLKEEVEEILGDRRAIQTRTVRGRLILEDE
jgi:hypothetical protein